MKCVKLKAHAKANLSLNIVGRDGKMHALDSVMVSLSAFDTVTVSERADSVIHVSSSFDIDPQSNTAYKAAAAVSHYIPHGLDVTVQKGIPLGAGLGGSSADAAAVLRAAELMYGPIPEIERIALGVGSDVPFMMRGGLGRVRGTGGDVVYINNGLPLYCVGYMGEDVSTAEAYAAFDALCPSGECVLTDNTALCDMMMRGDKGALDLFGNALFEPVCTFAPAVKKNMSQLVGTGAAPNLTGSGGMVLGWFASKEERDAFAAKTGAYFVMDTVGDGMEIID